MGVKTRWALCLTAGLIFGILIGGLGTSALSRIAGWGAEGYEDLAAISFGILGAVAGVIIGPIIGALVASYFDRLERQDEE